MLKKIKEKFIHILSENCGYYELEESEYNYRESLMKGYEKLSAQYETKIFEYDIIKHQFEEIIDIITDKATMPEIINLEHILKCYKYKNEKDYKKYLVAELEEILKIMKEKGIHPQDLIKRIINKANRDLKE